MKSVGVYKQDWFLALVIVVLFIVAVHSDIPLIEELESWSYNAGVQMTYRNPTATDRVVIIAVDDDSLEAIGRWPWSRNVLAELLQRLAKAGPKAVGLLIHLTEAQTDPGLAHIRRLRAYVDKTKFPRDARRQAANIRQMLVRAENNLNSDNRLARAIPRLKNLYMPMFFQLGEPMGKPDRPLPKYVRRNRITTTIARPEIPGTPPMTSAVRYPLHKFGRHTAGIGHLNQLKDRAGGVRTETLVLDYYNDYYPSLALLLAARSINLRLSNIKVEMGEGVRVGKLFIKTSPNMQMYTGFYPAQNGVSPFATYSFHNVHAGRLRPSVFKNKIVLIGATAVGVGDTHVTPVDNAMSGPQLTANVIASILNEDFYTRPKWTTWAELGIFAVIALYLMTLMPSMSARMAAAVSFFLLLLLLGAGHYLMVSDKIWLRSVSPALLLIVGHILLTTKRFLATERLQLEAESDSVHTNRMLGLAFQGQGQLDMAMDKFRKLPVDESVLELIYNLALDFERKRQFNKAGAAYDHIMRYQSTFRDVAQRKKRAQQADQTMILGSRTMTANNTIILDAVDQKPTLGRYEIERELGKGAMGTVYLGRDPKINRVVAIKTMALSEEFAADELKQVKERFFREAETAGRLNHPAIVTIYDAGEEHDLAYIAMEFLQGTDLTHCVSADKPPPLAWVLEVACKVTDALDYAHKQHVVHRDIKPANIMYNEEDGSIKVTDFGIARITASSRTKTGVVLGTPSYMSPEQLAGQHVDGRSDLFSLGVTLFELLTGKQPFTGDSMAALMYQIANARHPDAVRLRSGLPGCMRQVFGRLLHKNPDKRYQTGEELQQALLKCLGPAAEKESKAR